MAEDRPDGGPEVGRLQAGPPVGLEERAKATIRVGSKSFSLASLLFDSETMQAAHLLYAWCRHCDDQIDEASSHEMGRARLERLRELTLAAIEGRLDSDAELAFEAVGKVARRYRIPRDYFLDLLAGMEMDLVQNRYRDFAELRLYCYRVAGVVGLMMCHVMGVSDRRALGYAVDMGMAMQLTNIARDVRDDLALGRVYLPLDWLSELNLSAECLFVPEAAPQLVLLVERLLVEADALYVSGDRGLAALPLRAAAAVAAAREVYSGIGDKVRVRGARAWNRRTYLLPIEKFWRVLKGLARVAKIVPARLVRPWRPVALGEVWKFS